MNEKAEDSKPVNILKEVEKSAARDIPGDPSIVPNMMVQHRAQQVPYIVAPSYVPHGHAPHHATGIWNKENKVSSVLSLKRRSEARVQKWGSVTTAININHQPNFLQA